jgi:hypothetical protein
MSTPTQPSDIPLSNEVTAAAAALETPSLVVRSSGYPNNTVISLTNGTKLGLVQDIQWSMNVHGLAQAVVTTTATPAEFKALARDVTIQVRPAIGYHPFTYLWDWYATKARLAWERLMDKPKDEDRPVI